MALLIICGVNELTPVTTLQKYDIVDIIEEDISAGMEVYLETFLIARVPGKSVEEVVYLTMPEIEMVLTPPVTTPEPVVIKWRKYFYNFNEKLGSEKMAEIRASQEIMIVDIDINDIQEKV